MTVFVSYSTRDGDTVKSLTQDLQDADEQVWLDQRLTGGDTWWRAILEQIRGCDVFAFALSQNSIESKPCQAELEYARALGLPILPVQVGPVDSMQLNPLATVQTIDYRSPTPSTAMRLIAAVYRARAQRQPLPSPLPDEPEVPFEYLIRLYTTIGGPNYLSPREQAALVAELQVGLREDGQHDAARKDIVMLLTKLHDREDATHQTRTDVEAILASIGPESRRHPPLVTETTAVAASIVDEAKAAPETLAPSDLATPASGSTNVESGDAATRTLASAEPTREVVVQQPGATQRPRRWGALLPATASVFASVVSIISYLRWRLSPHNHAPTLGLGVLFAVIAAVGLAFGIVARKRAAENALDTKLATVVIAAAAVALLCALLLVVPMVAYYYNR